MERRTAIKLIGAGSVAVLLPATLSSCADKPLEALKPWEGPPVDEDIRLRLVSYGILAPNAHNKQPWIVDLRREGIVLHVDPTRLLPKTDPPARQIMISQGTFIETLVIAATAEGYAAEVTLFPDGVPSLEAIGSLPVARIALINRSTPKDDLFHRILPRHTNRRVYDGPPLTESESAALQAAYTDAGFPLRFYSEPSDVSTIARMMTESMHIETHTREMHAETVDMLRFTDEEVEKFRDGISFENLGITGMTLFLARMFAGREKAFDKSFLDRTVESVQKGAESARAIGLITSRGTSRVDEVTAGRHFARAFLTATKLGLSLQPMSQIMEIPTVKAQFMEFAQLQGEEPQMLFRLGRSNPTPHSPRRNLNDFLKA